MFLCKDDTVESHQIKQEINQTVMLWFCDNFQLYNSLTWYDFIGFLVWSILIRTTRMLVSLVEHRPTSSKEVDVEIDRELRKVTIIWLAYV